MSLLFKELYSLSNSVGIINSNIIIVLIINKGDDDIFKERCDTLLSKGTKVAFNGEFFEDLFVYLDTMDEIGSMYELGNCPLIEDNPVIIGNYPEK